MKPTPLTVRVRVTTDQDDPSRADQVAGALMYVASFVGWVLIIAFLVGRAVQ